MGNLPTRRSLLKGGAGAIVAALMRLPKAHAVPPMRGGRTGFQHTGFNPSSLPRLNASALTYLGCFEYPSTISGVDFTYSGGCLTTNLDTFGGLYPDGVLYTSKPVTFEVVRIAIPTRSQIANWATTMTTASVIGTPVKFPYTGGSGASIYQGGFLVYGGQLIYTQADVYGNNGQTATHGVASLDMSSITAMLPSSPAYGMRHVNSYMGNIPSQWQSAFGASYFCGAPIENTFQDCTTGVSLYTFNPQDVINAVNPIPMSVALDYQYVSGSDWSKSLGGNTAAIGWTNANISSGNLTNGSTTLTVTTVNKTIQVGAVGTGFIIASGGENVNTVAGAPIGATLLSQLSGTSGGAGTYQMSAPATADVTNGYIALGSADNGYMRPPDEKTAGIIFPSNSRTVAFIGPHGTGPLTYKNPNDNSGGWGASPYVRQCLMYDANDLVSVLNGSLNPYDPLPYLVFTMSVPSGAPLSTSGAQFAGIWYDDAPLNGNPSRIYMGGSNGATPYIHVYEVTH